MRASTVFSVHRFIAVGFGLGLLCFLDQLDEMYGGSGDIQWRERLLAQTWGAFILAVGVIVHCARSFAPNEQQIIAQSLALTFLAGGLTYGYILATLDDSTEEYVKSSMLSTLAIFISLFSAYTWAALEQITSREHPPTRLSTVMTYHAPVALFFGVLGILAPSVFYYDETPTLGELVNIRSWCVFLLAYGLIVRQGATGFSVSSQRTLAMILVPLYVTCGALFASYWGQLSVIFKLGSLPVFSTLTLGYAWGLLSKEERKTD